MEETGLTLEQYKRAIGILKRKGLVEVKVKKFAGEAISHLRLLQPIAADPPSTRCPTHQPVGVKDTILLTESTTENTDTDRSCTPFDDQDHRVPSQYQTGEDRERRREERVPVPREKERREVEDVQEQSADVKHDTIQIVGVPVQPAEPKKVVWMKAEDILKAHKGPLHGNLGAYWKSQCEVEFGGFQKALTGKECGQLKQLHKSLKEETRPVISYVISHWWKFASRAAASAGMSSWPVDPHIGFLLKHHAVAVNLLSLKQALPPPAAEPLPPPAINCSGTEEQPYVPSPQELTELLEGLKSP